MRSRKTVRAGALFVVALVIAGCSDLTTSVLRPADPQPVSSSDASAGPPQSPAELEFELRNASIEASFLAAHDDRTDYRAYDALLSEVVTLCRSSRRQVAIEARSVQQGAFEAWGVWVSHFELLSDIVRFPPPPDVASPDCFAVMFESAVISRNRRR
jgi:hypothetical protein